MDFFKLDHYSKFTRIRPTSHYMDEATSNKYELEKLSIDPNILKDCEFDQCDPGDCDCKKISGVKDDQ